MQRRVLIVEDESIVLNFIEAALKSSGHIVLAARSVKEARAIAAAELPKRDLCMLVDVVLGRDSGIAFAEEQIDRDPDTRVLLMSGYTDEVLLTRAGHVRRISFLRKPFSRQELLDAIEGMWAPAGAGLPRDA